MMARFKWHFVFDPLSHHQLKIVRVGPTQTKLSRCVHVLDNCSCLMLLSADFFKINFFNPAR